MKFISKSLYSGLLATVLIAPLLAADSTPTTAPVVLPSLDETPKMALETRSTVFFMEKGHYLQKALADLDQKDLLRSYMGDLDPLHLFLLESDVKDFQDLDASTLARDVREQGDLHPAFAIFQKYRDRVTDRVAWINKRLESDIDLTTTETYRPDRTDLPWPANMEDADKLWEKQLKFEMINELLALETRDINAANKKTATPAKGDQPAAVKTDTDITPKVAPAADAKPKTPAEKIAAAKTEIRKRYESYLHSRQETEAVEVQETFLNTLAEAYDPHSSFLSQYYLEEFDIAMRNSLVGIGAMLSEKDGYCLVHELVPNGPADKSGQIHPGDKIVGVGQATGDIADVVGAKLRKTVNMIRGAADTQVRLLLIPANDQGAKKEVTLTREEIKLTTNLAKAQIIDVPVGDKTVPVGVIDLPTFYGKGGGDSNFSTTDDVRELIGKLKAAGVQGLVLDLRRNGGGFLNEAIDLTGLFIPQGPVLQVRDTLGRLERLSDTDPAVAWDGPLLLLVSKMSASATEIMTGALQDYHRALVVGDHNTHGKGTVQAVYDFDRIDPSEKGAAKVTIQKWYLPDGNSIQSKGVAADIVLPSTIDYLPIGEADQKHALVWDSVPALPLTLKGDGPWRASLVDDPLLVKLRDDSMSRQGKLDEFSFLKDRITWEKARQEQKEYSLNYKERLAQRLADIDYRDKLKARLEAMVPANFKSTDVLLDAAKAQEDEKSKTAKADDKMPSPAAAVLSGDDDDTEAPINFDIQLREGLRIMSDWLVAEQDRAKLPTSIVTLASKTDATPTDGPAATVTAPAAAPRAQ